MMRVDTRTELRFTLLECRLLSTENWQILLQCTPECVNMATTYMNLKNYPFMFYRNWISQFLLLQQTAFTVAFSRRTFLFVIAACIAMSSTFRIG